MGVLPAPLRCRIRYSDRNVPPSYSSSSGKDPRCRFYRCLDFVRCFGTVWGVTIPSTVFYNEARGHSADLADEALAQYLKGGRAYQYATESFLASVKDPESLIEPSNTLFYKSLQIVWRIQCEVSANKAEQGDDEPRESKAIP
ncbi:hypothetical protein JX265_001946 [Neoarthrinium moseri]|uniref:Uncharacterized protein n=1 Tax=Neoarthrinium moseri TaxID=1658444 RepID=A0A9P9WW52_9PEZI|nr:hypothetical protein JX265_001946 [Neoarthrinium moseri]